MGPMQAGRVVTMAQVFEDLRADREELLRAGDVAGVESVDALAARLGVVDSVLSA